MRGTFALTNARVVHTHAVQQGCIVVRDGVIAHIVAGPEAPDVPVGFATDCEDDYVMPGMIDVHSDNLERHLRPRPGMHWSTDRAMLAHDAELASAGITTAFDAVTVGADVCERTAPDAFLEQMAAIASAQAEGLLRIDHQLHLRCELSSPGLVEALEHALIQRAPRLMSLMDHTPGQGQWTDLEHFRRHYSGQHGLTTAELDALVIRRQQASARFSASNRAAAIELASRHDCVLASHDDTTEADVERACRDGCSIAEFPTTLEAARAARSRRMRVVCGAPNLVRGCSHSGNVAASSLVREGICDIASSDYYPASLLHAAFVLRWPFGLTLPQAVAAVTANPAHALRLFDRGTIEEGKRADLVRVRETRWGPVVVAVWCVGRQVA